MIRLAIVEDERWEREGLVSLIDREKYGIEEIYTASNGIEGLDCIERIRPELIITDIRMPGLTGLEMIERAGRSVENSVCIILSGYNEFEYAQKALRIGAVDFLVKPVNERELESCLKKAVGMLEKLHKGNFVQRSAVEDLMQGTPDARRLRELLGVEALRGLRVAVYSGLQECSMQALYMGEAGENTYIVQRAQERLPKAGFSAAGISFVEREDGWAQALQQAERAMELARFHRMETPVYASELEAEEGKAGAGLRAEQLALRHAMASLEEEQVRSSILRVRRRMMAELRIDRQQAMRQIGELTEGILPGIETELAYAHTLDGMIDIAQARLIEHVRKAERSLSEPERYVVHRTIQLVEENYYNPDVNLQAIAGMIYLSPNYVGTLFKRSAGISFSDYLCRRRLMSAEQLLAEKGMKVADVAEAVGIPNVSYFCVQFRNMYRTTPSNYKKKTLR